jgi:hypothetical protein
MPMRIHIDRVFKEPTHLAYVERSLAQETHLESIRRNVVVISPLDSAFLSSLLD